MSKGERNLILFVVFGWFVTTAGRHTCIDSTTSSFNRGAFIGVDRRVKLTTSFNITTGGFDNGSPFFDL